jgi:hypothetical protein
MGRIYTDFLKYILCFLPVIIRLLGAIRVLFLSSVKLAVPIRNFLTGVKSCNH